MPENRPQLKVGDTVFCFGGRNALAKIEGFDGAGKAFVQDLDGRRWSAETGGLIPVKGGGGGADVGKNPWGAGGETLKVGDRVACEGGFYVVKECQTKGPLLFTILQQDHSAREGVGGGLHRGEGSRKPRAEAGSGQVSAKFGELFPENVLDRNTVFF